MRIAVVGSRSISVSVALPIIHSFFDSGHWSCSGIVSGGAHGVDSAAATFARSRYLPLSVFLPNYFLLGISAPLHRNALIVEASDTLFCIFDGPNLTGGSFHVVERAHAAGLPIVLFDVSSSSYVPVSAFFLC